MKKHNELLDLRDRVKYPKQSKSYREKVADPELKILDGWLDMKSGKNNPNKLLDLQRAVFNWRHITGKPLNSKDDTLEDVEQFVKILYKSKASDEVKKSWGEFLCTGKRSFLKWKYPEDWVKRFRNFEDESEERIFNWKAKGIDERLTDNDILTPEENEKLWKHGVKKIRDKCIVKIHVTTPIRTKELREAVWENILWDKKRIRVHDTKMDQPREMPLDDKCIQILRKWRDTYHIEAVKKWAEINPKNLSPKKHWKIFPSRSDPEKAISHTGIWLIFKRAGERIGLKKNIYGYLTRHSFITNAQDKGVDVRDVMQVAGHKSINTTLRYTHLNKNKAINSIIDKVFKEEQISEEAKNEYKEIEKKLQINQEGFGLTSELLALLLKEKQGQKLTKEDAEKMANLGKEIFNLNEQTKKFQDPNYRTRIGKVEVIEN